MNRKSLLDDAITKAKEAEDWQLVEWLRMARGGESAAKWYTTKLDQLSGENVKLKKLAHDLLQPILADGFDCYGCVYEDDCEGMHYTDRCRLLDWAHELGVEVDE